MAMHTSRMFPPLFLSCFSFSPAQLGDALPQQWGLCTGPAALVSAGGVTGRTAGWYRLYISLSCAVKGVTDRPETLRTSNTVAQ